MTLLAFGINHKTAPVDIREKVAFAPDKLGVALQELLTLTAVNEAAIVSTCNRTELYCDLSEADSAEVVAWFRAYHSLSAEELDPYIYTHLDNQAVQHILRVASGLDSLVLGEPQILGQIKDAYHTASQAGAIGHLLNRLFKPGNSLIAGVRNLGLNLTNHLPVLRNALVRYAVSGHF